MDFFPISRKSIDKKKDSKFSSLFDWLAYQDSNLDKQNQNLLCYHYTISQYLCAMDYFQKRCKDKHYFFIYQILKEKNKRKYEKYLFE